MYLKEAFRYQNFMSSTIDEIITLLQMGKYTMKVIQHHLRSKVNKEADDETIDVNSDRSLPYTADELIKLLEHLVKSKEELSKAINAAKNVYNLDIDAEISNNRIRRKVADCLLHVSRLKSSERFVRGSAYKFNAEGNQVPYSYDIKEVTTIDFDRKKAKAIAKGLGEEADSASAAVDEAMVCVHVQYDPEFSVGDTLEDILEEFFKDDPAHTDKSDD